MTTKKYNKLKKEAAKIAAGESKKEIRAWNKAVERWKGKDAWIETVFVNNKNI